MARAIGIKNLKYALITKGPDGAIKYGTPTAIPKVISVNISDEYNSYTFYSEDTVEESNGKLVSSEIEIEVGYLEGALKAILTGANFDEETGKLTRNSADVSPMIALMFEITKSEGAKSDFRCLLNCAVRIEESENTTTEDGVESNNVIIVGTATPDADGDIDYQVFNGDAATFFKAVEK